MNLPYWLAALYLPGIGPRTFARLLEQFSDIKKIFSATGDDLRAAGLPAKLTYSFLNPNWKSVEKDLAWAQLPGNHLIALEDPDYPAPLKEISDPPLLLYCRGDRSALSKLQIAIVGSRNATSAGLNNAEQFAYCLAESGFAITSGLALGVDGASHRGALTAQGVTIAVQGTGLNHIYPRSHRPLAEEIVSQRGAIISEFPLATPPQAMNFPRRNRIIGGLCVGVLVVEAAVKSGSLITARHALEQGREVFAIPGSIHHPLARGCHHLIRQGAKLVETAADIIEELGAHRAIYSPEKKTGQIDLMIDLTQECRQLLEKIDYAVTPLDMIILRSGLTASEVSSILLSLELQSCIQSVPGGYIRG